MSRKPEEIKKTMPDNNQMHPFDKAVDLTETSPYTYQGHIPQSYGNMIGPFGGVIVAVILNGMMSHKERQGDPVSLTVNFAGPIEDDPFELGVRPVRINRSNQHWTAELTQSSQVVATATAVLATRRETWMMSEASFPTAQKPEEIESWSVPVGPEWINRYDFKFVHGQLTLNGPAKDSESLLWVRDAPERPLDFLSLAAISDVFFPRIIVLRQELGVASTVSITTHFHADTSSLTRQSIRPILGAARGQRFYRGYFDQVAELWSDDGELLASSIQMVYFKD